MHHICCACITELDSICILNQRFGSCAKHIDASVLKPKGINSP